MLLENNLTYKSYSKIDIQSIQKKFTNINRMVWNSDKSRVESNSPHLKTQSLFLAKPDGPIANFVQKYYHNNGYPSNEFKKDIKNIKEIIVDEELNQLTKDIVSTLEKQFDGVSGLVMYTKLFPKEKIKPHKDPGFYLSAVHRLHIPIYTNHECMFTIGSDTFHMEEGRLYEISNLLLHSVENNGESERIHLIVDIIPNSVLN
jgi:hypothetical protein